MVSIFMSLETIHVAYGATAFIVILQLVSSVGWLPIRWFYLPEITSTQLDQECKL